MATIGIINGEQSWAQDFPAHTTVHLRVQETSWVLRNGELWAVTRSDANRLDAVIWRVGAIRVSDQQRSALGTIRLSGVPCFSPAKTLTRCQDRLHMLAELRELEIPIARCDIGAGDFMWKRHSIPYPFVVKVGSHHGGLGKHLLHSAQEWEAVSDLLYAANDFVAVEPYYNYARDVRCFLIGGHTWSMERRSQGWRANANTTETRLIDTPDELRDWTMRAAEELGTTVLALDALQLDDGSWVVLEVNETPGFKGWPAALRDHFVALVEQAL